MIKQVELIVDTQKLGIHVNKALAHSVLITASTKPPHAGGLLKLSLWICVDLDVYGSVYITHSVLLVTAKFSSKNNCELTAPRRRVAVASASFPAPANVKKKENKSQIPDSVQVHDWPAP